MKWFKHMSDMSGDEFIAELEHVFEYRMNSSLTQVLYIMQLNCIGVKLLGTKHQKAARRARMAKLAKPAKHARDIE